MATRTFAPNDSIRMNRLSIGRIQGIMIASRGRTDKLRPRRGGSSSAGLPSADAAGPPLRCGFGAGSAGWCATRLRYAPTDNCTLILTPADSPPTANDHGDMRSVRGCSRRGPEPILRVGEAAGPNSPGSRRIVHASPRNRRSRHSRVRERNPPLQLPAPGAAAPRRNTGRARRSQLPKKSPMRVLTRTLVSLWPPACTNARRSLPVAGFMWH
jgi:hypothetical protein